MDVRGLFFAIVLAVLAWLTYLLVRPFQGFLLTALLLAFVLYPAQERLEPYVGSTIAAVGLVTGSVLLLVAITFLFVVTIPAGTETIAEQIERAPALESVAAELQESLGVEIPVQSIASEIPQRVGEFAANRALGYFEQAVHTLIGLGLLIFVVFYLLQDGESFFAWIERSAPMDADVYEELEREASEVTWAVIKGHVFIAIVQGIVAGIGFLVVGLPNVVFWTLVMIFLSFLPIIGVVVVYAPAIVFLALDGSVLAAVFLAVYGVSVVALIDDYLRAIVVDRQSSLHSAVILVGVFGGIYVFGAMGLFIGPIVLALFAAAVRVFNRHYAPSS